MCAKKAVRQIVKQSRLPRRREKEEDASLIMRPKEKHCHLAVHKGYLNSQLHGIGMTITLYNLDIASTNFVVGGNDGMMSSRKRTFSSKLLSPALSLHNKPLRKALTL